MNVLIRPQFYLDVEAEVYWLLTHADATVAQRWHGAVWETIERSRSLAGNAKTSSRSASVHGGSISLRGG